MMLTPSSSLPRSYVLASRAVRRIKAIDPTPSDQKAAILAVWISAVIVWLEPLAWHAETS